MSLMFMLFLKHTEAELAEECCAQSSASASYSFIPTLCDPLRYCVQILSVQRECARNNETVVERSTQLHHPIRESKRPLTNITHFRLYFTLPSSSFPLFQASSGVDLPGLYFCFSN